jgi:hypothetical protein
MALPIRVTCLPDSGMSGRLTEVDRPGSHPGVPVLYRAFDLAVPR